MSALPALRSLRLGMLPETQPDEPPQPLADLRPLSTLQRLTALELPYTPADAARTVPHLPALQRLEIPCFDAASLGPVLALSPDLNYLAVTVMDRWQPPDEAHNVRRYGLLPLQPNLCQLQLHLQLISKSTLLALSKCTALTQLKFLPHDHGYGDGPLQRPDSSVAADLIAAFASLPASADASGCGRYCFPP